VGCACSSKRQSKLHSFSLRPHNQCYYCARRLTVASNFRQETPRMWESIRWQPSFAKTFMLRTDVMKKVEKEMLGSSCLLNNLRQALTKWFDGEEMVFKVTRGNASHRFELFFYKKRMSLSEHLPPTYVMSPLSHRWKIRGQEKSRKKAFCFICWSALLTTRR